MYLVRGFPKVAMFQYRGKKMDIHSSLIQTLYHPPKAQNPHDLEDHTFASPEALAISAKPDIFGSVSAEYGG